MVVKKQTPVKGVAKKKSLKPVKSVSKSTSFPVRQSKYPASMSTSQKKRAAGASSHRERVLMRAILRKSGTIPRDAPNAVGDQWLQQHGWLYAKGYDPPSNRVSKLSKAVGFKRRPTAKQLGIT